MGLISRLLGFNKKLVDVMEPIDADRGVYKLKDTIRLKYRVSQQLPMELSNKLIEICRSEPSIDRAWFLDVLEQPTGDMKLFISLSLDTPEVHLPRIVDQMRAILRTHKSLADKYYIGAYIIAELKPDEAAFVR